MRGLVRANDWMASYGTEERKIELDSISMAERLQQLFAVYVTERNFLTEIFLQKTEFFNGRTAKRQWKNDNGIVETGHYG